MHARFFFPEMCVLVNSTIQTRPKYQLPNILHAHFCLSRAMHTHWLPNVRAQRSCWPTIFFYSPIPWLLGFSIQPCPAPLFEASCSAHLHCFNTLASNSLWLWISHQLNLHGIPRCSAAPIQMYAAPLSTDTFIRAPLNIYIVIRYRFLWFNLD